MFHYHNRELLTRHQASLQVDFFSYLFMSLHEIQVLEGGAGLLRFPLTCLPLVGGALQVILLVVPHARRQQVVHHHYTDVDTPTL